MGTLYLVATPIGNLGDITTRAVRVLREVPLIAAEDTRHTGRLLAHLGVHTPLVSYHEHNARARRDGLLDALAVGDLALVSDAGSPGLSDPGHDLVVAAVAAGHPVSPVPGPSSLVAAATASGLVPGPFVMLGFLPRRGLARRAALGRAAATGLPLVVFEAPPRLAPTLAEMADLLGPRPAAVARELTKLHEEIRRGPLRDLAAHYAAEPARGEVVVVVGAAEAADAETDGTDDAAAVLRGLLRAGLGPSQAAREAAAVTGRPRSDLYALARTLGEAAGRPGVAGHGDDLDPASSGENDRCG